MYATKHLRYEFVIYAGISATNKISFQTLDMSLATGCVKECAGVGCVGYTVTIVSMVRF